MAQTTLNTPQAGNPQLVKPAESEPEFFDLGNIFYLLGLYWYWFAASAVACLVAAFVYLLYATPIYSIDGSVMIKEQDKSQASAAGGALSSVANLGEFSMTNNFDNEVMALQSRTLIEKVVTELGLYVDTKADRQSGYDHSLYGVSPVTVAMNAAEASELPSDLLLRVQCKADGSNVALHLRYRDEDKQKVDITEHFDTIPSTFQTPVGTLMLSWNPEHIISEEDINLLVTILTPSSCAANYKTALTVRAASKTTTIASLVLNDADPKRGIDFMYRLLDIYNRDVNDEKNEVAQKTADFIDGRMAVINQELGNTENQMANFKQSEGLTDLAGDNQLALTENSRYDQKRIENATQISLVEYLQDYINNPDHVDDVIPANVGLSDDNLTKVINQYNTQLMEKKSLLRVSSEKNPAAQKLSEEVSVLRSQVKTTIESVLRGLRIEANDITAQSSKIKNRISSAPIQEKQYLNIARQQEIKAALYTMLLQKREENAITLAATANNGRFLETPQVAIKPVAPKKQIILLVALALGLCLPMVVLYLIDLLKYKIENRADVERLTKLPVIAEIPTAQKKSEHGAIVVRENKNDIMEETYRGLRTNLLFLLEKGQQVIMFSSTQPGEGKSFIAGNTAASLAYLGKKVIVVGMDIRKPGLNKVFAMDKRAEGVTDFLRDPDTDLQTLIQQSAISQNLDILPGGAVPPNPTELVTRSGLDKLFAQLRQIYDYVIVDTAPIAMVADSAIISRIADVCVYVCRADVTPKAGFMYVNELDKENRFSKIAIVLNDIDMQKRKNSYGYGYGKRYGYGYGKRYGQGYGYGYGYGYGFDKSKDKTTKK